MSETFWELAIIFVLILCNGFFAASEIAIVSARKGRLQQRAEDGDGNAQVALDLAENPNRFLSTVQVGISLVGTFAAAFGGDRIAKRLQPLLEASPLLQPYATTLSLLLVVLLITYFSLIFGELVPKRLALQNAERVAIFVAPVMRMIARFGSPVVGFLTISTELVLRLFGRRSADDDQVTEEDIMSMVREGTAGGSLDQAHQDLIESVFTFTERGVRAIMTPRTEILALDGSISFERALHTISESGYSRIPVYRETLDDVLGILYVKDLLRVWGAPAQIDLAGMLRPAVFVLESQRVVEVFQQLKQGQAQMALVLDEYGQVAGLVTLEDMLEELVGDITDEYDEAGEAIVRREDGSYLIDGLTPFDEVKELLKLPALDRDLEEIDFETIAGFVLALLGHIPTAGALVAWHGYSFEVVDMDERRIDKLLIRPPDA